MKNIKALALLLIVLVALSLTLVSCGGKDDHVHEYIDATCTTPKTCSCGATEGEALGHTPVTDAAVQPTCTLPGRTEGSHCSVCYAPIVLQTEIPATGHSYDDGVVTAPTCTEAGYTTYTCECGHSYQGDEANATGHEYTEEVTAPTCTEAGYTTYTCECGHSYQGDEVEATGHSYGEGVVTAPTCTEAGYTTYTCECGHSYTDNEANATGHSYGEGVVTAPTCTENGYTTYTCECGHSYKGDEVEATGHTYVGVVTNPTCDEDGYTTFTCECGASYKEAGVEAMGHAYDGGVVTAPTCTEKGYTTYTCFCGHSYQGDEVEATGHSYDDGVVTAPTCTEIGYTTYTCECGHSYTDNEVEATGHSYDDGVVTAPTCTAAGNTKYTCSCGHSYSEPIAALGHIDENLDVECDRECGVKVAPAADSVLSIFTANCVGNKLSTSNMYYVEGTIVEVENASTGVFWITDDSGERFYLRLPTDADGNTYNKWDIKLVVGDKIKIYGTIEKYSTNDAPYINKGVLELVEAHPHDFTYSPADCENPAECACGVTDGEALGHIDEGGDGKCDRCEWLMNASVEEIVTSAADVPDENKTDTNMTVEGTEFNVVVEKGTATSLNTTASGYLNIVKNNKVVVSANNGKKITSITFVATATTFANNIQKSLTAGGYTATVNGTEVTVEVESAESFTLTATLPLRIASVKVAYT